MTYSSGGPGYPGAQQSGPYAPTTQFAKVGNEEPAGPSKLPVYLLAGVAVLGLAAYLLSFGPVWEGASTAGFGVALGLVALLFAGVFAVIGLLPKQRNYYAVIAAVAVVGFLLTILDLIQNADAAGWALIAIVIVSALQTVAAIAALLLDAGVITPPAPRPKYDPYQQYGGYYGQPQFGQPPTTGPQPLTPGPQGYGQPPGYPSYGGYAGGPPSGGFPAPGHHPGPPTPPTGFPTYAQPASQGEQQQPTHDAPTQEAPKVERPAEQPSSSPSAPPPS